MKAYQRQNNRRNGSRFANWLGSRYGADRLSSALLVAGLAVMTAGRILRARAACFLGDIMAIFSVVRTYSPASKAARRQRELAWFDRNFKGISDFFSLLQRRAADREHKYVRCRTCGRMLRVPRNQGSIVITCSGCGSKINTKS